MNPSPSSTLSKANRDLFDQSALSDLAQRLVEAARRVSADGGAAGRVRGALPDSREFPGEGI
ncbi:MAG: hypothetical protein JSV48_08565, partial [Bradyrhizobium sp.]